MSLYLKTLELEGIKTLNSKEIFLQNEAYDNKKRIGILNLMPLKGETEGHILKMLLSSKEEIFVDFIRIKSHKSKLTSQEYLNKNYSTFNELKNKLDGVIITGAPLETLEFNDISYKNELREIIEFLKNNKRPTFYICWGAQMALNYIYGVRKINVNSKIFGVFSHEVLLENEILKGIENDFKCPHSRHSTLCKEDIIKDSRLRVLAESEIGEYSLLKGSYNDYYILGHLEYDKEVLKNEYLRDKNKGANIELPRNYFLGNNIENEIIFSWEETGKRIYKNWINFVKNN